MDEVPRVRGTALRIRRTSDTSSTEASSNLPTPDAVVKARERLKMIDETAQVNLRRKTQPNAFNFTAPQP